MFKYVLWVLVVGSVTWEVITLMRCRQDKTWWQLLMGPDWISSAVLYVWGIFILLHGIFEWEIINSPLKMFLTLGPPIFLVGFRKRLAIERAKLNPGKVHAESEPTAAE